MAVQYLDRGNDDGTEFGQSSAHLIGFYGLTTPIAQPAGATNVTTTAATSGSSPFGFSEAQANAIVKSLNRVIDILAELGLSSNL